MWVLGGLGFVVFWGFGLVCDMWVSMFCCRCLVVYVGWGGFGWFGLFDFYLWWVGFVLGWFWVLVGGFVVSWWFGFCVYSVFWVLCVFIFGW